MRNSMFDDTAARLALAPAVRAANGAVNGPTIDLAGTKNNFRAAMLVVVAGAVTDGTHTVSLEHSDTGVGGWTAVAAEEREGSYPAISTAQSNTSYRVGYNVVKRYVRAVCTTSGAPGSPVGGIISAVMLMSQGSGRPVT